jgi:hypothetical protein
MIDRAGHQYLQRIASPMLRELRIALIEATGTVEANRRLLLEEDLVDAAAPRELTRVFPHRIFAERCLTRED